MDKGRIEMLWAELIDSIGDDVERSGLKATPGRIAEMYEDVFVGYDETKLPEITVFDDMQPQGLLIDKGYFFSFCEHHILPFFGEFYFGYICDQCYPGASKIGRTVDYFAARLQIAERLCVQVIERIEDIVKPKGSILLMSGRHLCKEMRGIKKVHSPFEVIEARGLLLSNDEGCKDEFMARIGSRL